jgi:hypothetical protein
MKKIFDYIKTLPLHVRVVLSIIFGAFIILVIPYLFSIILSFFSKDPVLDNKDYIIEETRIKTEIEILKKERENSKRIIDSLEKIYKSKNITKENEKITNKYKDEKNRISNLPIDSIVSNLSRWVSEDNLGK